MLDVSYSKVLGRKVEVCRLKSRQGVGWKVENSMIVSWKGACSSLFRVKDYTRKLKS